MPFPAIVPTQPLVESAAGRVGSDLAAFGVRAGVVLLATSLTGASSQLSVTVPWTAVPFTMQPVAVLLAGAVLGARLALLSQVLYLFLGVTGAAMFALSPVLAPGLARLLGPTGGFLMAFPLAAFATGWLAERGWTRNYAGALASMAAGLVVLYAAGALWLALVAGPASLSALWAFAVSDVVKVAVAAGVLPLAVRAFGPSR